tara:strand:- start:856 stop:1257 length:402 start_codon:yes stop_codon:yes gene_type:complete
MALGKIKADTLEHSTAGSLDTKFVVNGSAKAWATADNNTTLQDTFNISGITDVSTGVSTLAFSNVMNNNLYALTAIGNFGGGTNDLSCISWDQNADLATASSKTYFIASLNGGGTPANQDLERGCYHWLGDLA